MKSDLVQLLSDDISVNYQIENKFCILSKFPTRRHLEM
jgi:hypothetical protein